MWVLEEPYNCVLVVINCLRRIEATGIVFTHTNLQNPIKDMFSDDGIHEHEDILDLLIQLDVLELVSGCDDPVSGLSIVTGNDGAAGNKIVVQVEDETGPRELSWGRFSMFEVGDWKEIVPSSALLS